MDIPMANVETIILNRRQILGDESDFISDKHVHNGTEEDTSVDIHVYVEEMIHSQLMTVKQNPHRKNGKFYIDKMNSTKPTDFSFGDELVKVGSEVLADTTKETIQNHFNFDADENGRRSKTLTIRRTEDGKTEEIDVEVVLVTKFKSPEHASRANTRFRSPRRRTQRPQKNRNILFVQERPGAEKVFIQTTDRKYLTVKDGAVVGDWMGRNNRDDFLFDLVTVNAMYETNPQRKKQVICCKIKWNTFWLKTKLRADGNLEIEWTEEDADDHTNVFKRRVTSDGRNLTGFESLLLKNVFLQYNPRSSEVEVNSKHPHVNLGKTLQQVPRSSRFKVIDFRTHEEMGRRSNIYHSSNARHRSSALRSYIGKCLPFFRRSSSSDTNGSTDNERTLSANDISGRSERDG